MNKWDIPQLLCAGDELVLSDLDFHEVLSPDPRNDFSFLDLGDGLYVRAEIEDGRVTYSFSTWFRTRAHLHYRWHSTAFFKSPLPSANEEEFPEPPGVTRPLSWRNVLDSEKSAGRFQSISGIFTGPEFSRTELVASSPALGQQTSSLAKYYFLATRPKNSDLAFGVQWLRTRAN